LKPKNQKRSSWCGSAYCEQKKRGDCPRVLSNRAVHKRLKFTAKAQSSPSPRTRKEAPGADPPIANRKNVGTVPEFCPKFTAKAQSSPSPRTRQEAPGADPPIANRKNSGTVPEFCQKLLVRIRLLQIEKTWGLSPSSVGAFRVLLLLGCISQNAGYSQSPMQFRRPSNWQELQKLIMFSEFQMLAKRHSNPS
jgi:hypothetical protein